MANQTLFEIQKPKIVFVEYKNQDELQNLVNKNLKMNGLDLLDKIGQNKIKACFFDPQYRGVLDKLGYGNEGKSREVRRCELEQMSEETIVDFLTKISNSLVASGHLFLWIDKFHLCEGVSHWFKKTDLSIVDLVTWEKSRIGMGYRTRRKSEYLMILQKKPNRAKGCWTIHNIPDVWLEKVETKTHPHSKPIGLQQRLIEAISIEGDLILDPAMGSGSVFEACQNINRNFIGCDLNGKD